MKEGDIYATLRRLIAELGKKGLDYAVIGGTMKGDKLVYNDSGRWLRDVIIDFIKIQREISPKVEGRIREVK